jgi:hypothetical protein
MYRIYDLQGEYQQHSLGAEAAELGIIDARIHDSGFVALTSTLSLVEVKNWDGGRPLTLANPGELPGYFSLAIHCHLIIVERSYRTSTLVGDYST